MRSPAAIFLINLKWVFTHINIIELPSGLWLQLFQLIYLDSRYWYSGSTVKRDILQDKKKGNISYIVVETR